MDNGRKLPFPRETFQPAKKDKASNPIKTGVGCFKILG
jgi:hypothetical protein